MPIDVFFSLHVRCAASSASDGSLPSCICRSRVALCTCLASSNFRNGTLSRLDFICARFIACFNVKRYSASAIQLFLVWQSTEHEKPNAYLSDPVRSVRTKCHSAHVSIILVSGKNKSQQSLLYNIIKMGRGGPT